MSNVPERLAHLRSAIRAGRILALGGTLALAVVGILLAAGDLLTEKTSLGEAIHSTEFLVGLGLVAAAVALGAALVFLSGVIDIFQKIESNTFRAYDVTQETQRRIAEFGHHLESIAENAQLSDVARSISHRDKERNALRLAINDEIIRGDWEAAYALVDQLETRYGYKNEAARLRTDLDRSRQESVKFVLHEHVEKVRGHMAAHDWDRARREMDRLLSSHPTDPAVQALPELFGKLRDEHKRDLLQQWNEAVQRNEVDRGIALLKELEPYLTAREAAALKESARGVFHSKLQNMGVQFSLAVTDGEWRQALEIGHRIIAEFPNSRMAHEVQERLHVLRKRAEEPAPAGAAPGGTGGTPAT